MSKNKFVTRAMDNILNCYWDTTLETRQAGLEWYPKAELISRELLPNPRQAAGVIAALSPRQSWKINVAGSRAICRAASQGNRIVPRVAGMYANVNKAWRIANGEEPLDVFVKAKQVNFKVLQFFRNISGDTEAVTVDQWAARVAFPEEEFYAVRGRRYLDIQHAYRLAAGVLGIAPRDLQATCWIHVRGSAE